MIGLIIIKCLRSGHTTDVAAAATDDVAVVVAAEWADLCEWDSMIQNHNLRTEWMEGVFFVGYECKTENCNYYDPNDRRMNDWMRVSRPFVRTLRDWSIGVIKSIIFLFF